MTPQAPSLTGLAPPAAPTGQTPISPNGAPGVPALPQGTLPPAQATTQPSQFNTQGSLDAIANYYQIPRQTAQAAAGVEGNKFNATTAYEGQLQEQSQFAKEQLDASAYKIQQTANGLQILDPVTGQTVDTNTYANRTGSEGINNLVSAAAKSPNARDQQFASDYNDFNTYMNSKLKEANSPEDKQIAQSYESAVKKAYGIDLASMSPQQVAQQFNSEYGDYLGVGQSGPTPSKPIYTPSLSPQDINYLMSRYIYSGNPANIQVPGIDTSFGLGTSGGSSAFGVSTNQFAPTAQQ